MNVLRMRRVLPEKQFPNSSKAKLRFYYGAVGSVGYTRFRRVHRGGSSLHTR